MNQTNPRLINRLRKFIPFRFKKRLNFLQNRLNKSLTIL